MTRSATADQRTLLLTGATGFLGSHLALAFLGCGYRLKILARSRGAGSELRLKRVLDAIQPTPLLSYLLSGQLELVQGDVTARHLGLSARTVLRLAAEVTDVVQCAAIVSFDPLKAGELQQVNVEGTRNVLEFAELGQGATFHYVSTAFVAGRRRGPVQESDLDGAAGFNNAYEESKFLAELEVRKAMADGLPAVVYRPSILVGDSRTGQTQSFIGFYILLRSLELVALRARRLLERKPTQAAADGVMVGDGWITVPLRVQGSESKTLNIIPVDYAVRAIQAIFQDPDSLGKTFHVVNPAPPTIGRLRDWMCAALGMRGVRLVSADEFARRPVNRLEHLFAKSTEEYGAYLGGEEPAFQADDTLKVIRREEIPQPCTDADFICRLVEYCQASRWGKRRVKVPVGQPTPSR